MKSTPSNRSALTNSGGNFEASLHVPMKKTSLPWSFSHVSSELSAGADAAWAVFATPSSGCFGVAT
jgi:hypothetical protein